MTGRQWFREIIPASRRPVTFGRFLPYGIFLLLFGGGTLYLVLSHRLTFAAPWAFLLLAVTPWFWWMHTAAGGGMPAARAAAALSIRLLIVGAFIYALAEPRAVRGNNDLAVLFAMDLSDSVGERAGDQALKFIVNAVNKKPEKDSAGLVVFGRDAAVELPPRITFPFEAVNSRVGRDATNLEKGLSLTAAMIPDASPGRIVLISDGTSTEGNLTPVLEQLAARQVPVDVLPIQYAYEEEVWLEKLELPKIVKVGETYEAAVILSSLRPGSGKLTLRENDQLIFEDTVTYEAGKNRFTLPLYLRAPGFYEYVARIEPPPGRDGWAENNVAVNHLYIRGEGKVLLVTDPAGEPKDWQSFAASLKRADRVVELRPAYEFPRDALSLLPYDCVVFANVPADALDGVQMEALRDSVFNQGTGFLMIGGKNSFGPGGYNRTPVEEALPVTMDVTQKKVLPKGALIIILHTCEFPEGNTWGKRIAKEAIRVLSAKDEVAILAEGGGPNGWMFHLTPAGEYQKLFPLIEAAQIGDMGSYEPTMQQGLNELVASDAAAKHMIIISDGDPSPPTPKMIQDFQVAHISVSTVAIFPHGGTEVATLKSIAAATGGRYYYPQDPNLLPSIFIKEAKTIRRSMIQNGIFTPLKEFPSPILKGIEAIPPLTAFVLTTPKEHSTVVLRSPEQEETDPVLATWRYGVGKSAAFTGDLSPNWGAAWVEWEKYDAFVKQLMIDISRVEQKSDLQVSSFSDGGNGVMVAEDFKPQAGFLQVEAQVSGPRGRAERVQLKQVAPGRYQAEFPLWGMGHYQVTVLGQGDGRNERATGGFAVPYSPEYLRFSSNGSVLERIAHATGGRVLAGTETAKDIFPADRPWRRSSRPILEWVLIVLACLIPLDVGVRRVQLDWAVIRGWFVRRKKAEQDQTLGALLQRKQQIKFAPSEKPAERRIPTHIPARPRAEPGGPRPAAPPQAPPPAPGPSGTTGRLLEMKKKWQKPEEKK